MSAYQPYRGGHNTARPQSMALAAMLAGRGVNGNPMDVTRQLARRATLMQLLQRRAGGGR